MKTVNITLQIPLKDYGPIATLAAAANMPLDQYVLNEGLIAKSQEQK